MLIPQERNLNKEPFFIWLADDAQIHVSQMLTTPPPPPLTFLDGGGLGALEQKN
jgi:hypothetical protein